MKNNQWIIEPFSNMISSLCIIDTGLKRINKITDNKKLNENAQLMRLSLCQQFNQINQEMNKIVNNLFDKNKRKEVSDKINKYKVELSYNPDEIKLMKDVVKTLYKNKKYYLES